MSTEHALFVGNIPEFYDRNMGPVLFVDYADDIARRVAVYRPKHVLETACGTGIVSLRLRRALAADATLISTDLNSPMIEVARSKLTPGDEIQFQTADAQDLVFADRTFDAVVCQFGVMFYPDKDKSYREVFRVLQPGGHYVFNVWDSHRHNAFARLGHGILQTVFPVDPPQFMTIPFSYPFEPIKESLIDAGFVDIEVSVVRQEKDIPSIQAFAEGFVYGTPVIDQIEARGGIDPVQIVGLVAGAFQVEFGTDPGRMILQALVFTARKPD